MKKLFKRFTAIILSFAVLAASLCTTAYADKIVGNGLIVYNDWEACGYSGKTLNKLYSDDKVSSIVANIKADWTDVQKAAYVYSYIHNYYGYSTNGSIMGCIQAGNCICTNYADIYYTIMKACGVPTLTISIMLNNVGHAVNLTQIEGKWYHIDCQDTFLGSAWKDGYYDGGTGILPSDSSIANTSDFTSRKAEAYFEFNGQWYAYGSSVYKIPSSLKNENNSSWNEVFSLKYNADPKKLSFKEKSELSKAGKAADPKHFAYDNNGKLYYDHGNDIYVYNAATNSTSCITSINNKVAWIGVDKYAVYYVTKDGKFGSASIVGNSTSLETTKSSLVMRAGEAAYNTAVTSTEYLCGYQLSYKSSDDNIAAVDRYGMVYAKKAGTAYITVSYMGRSSDYKVTVKDMNYTGSVDSVPYVKLNTGNYYTDEVVNAYDPRLGNNSEASASDSGSATTAATSNKAVYNVANSKVYLQRNVPIDLKYFTKIDEATRVTTSNSSRVKVTKTDTGYTITALSGTGYITIKNGSESNKIYVVATKKTTPPSYLKFKISTKKISIGKTFTITATSNCDSTDELTWIFSNDNIKVATELNEKGNTIVKFKAVTSGTTKVYCLTSSGVAKSFTVTVK